MDPVDPVVAGGTFSGNLFGCAAGIASLSIMEREGFFESWIKRVNDFYSQFQTIFDEANFPAIVQGLGCTFGIYIGTREPVTNYHHIAERTNPELRKVFFLKCIEKGLYFHTDFTISTQHDEALLAQSLDILREVVRETKKEM
jgi:glutamate-1-semialdehyde 2,1-aminomutase